MKKLTPVLFIIVGLLIAGIIINQNIRTSEDDSLIQSNNFTHAINAEPGAGQQAVPLPGNEDFDVLIPLFPDEILITAIPVDFNLDNYADQVVAVKNTDSPFVKVIIGLYNPLFAAYERSYELETPIQETNTFSLDVIDITGTHANSLIVNGYSSTNDAIFQAWLSTSNTTAVNLELIADFRADGTIFISQSTRSTSYAFSDDHGESYPIWVYTSDPQSTQGSLDQLQTMYDWDYTTSRYIQSSQVRIPGRQINAQELEKILDGTEKTMGEFLSDSWQSTTTAVNNSPYLSFDYETKTITFLNNDTAEIYMWENSILRRNGILISASNRNIPALMRRIDITLISLDEIRVKSTDTLTITVSQNTSWDGNYKKQHSDSINPQIVNSIKTENITNIIDTIKTTSEKLWETDNGDMLTFTDNSYIVKNDAFQDSGIYNVLTVYEEQLVQFRSNNTDSKLFDGFYRIHMVEEDNSRVQIVFTPVNIGSTYIVPSINQNITLRQVIR